MAKKSGTAQVVFLGIVIGVVVVSCSGNSKSNKPKALTAKEQCIENNIYDTTALNTSRLAVRIHYENQRKGELAKYVSDREAISMVYCGTEQQIANSTQIEGSSRYEKLPNGGYSYKGNR